MIIRWLQSIVGTKRSQEGHYPEPITTHSLIDVAHEVLSKEALEKKMPSKILKNMDGSLGKKKASDGVSEKR